MLVGDFFLVLHRLPDVPGDGLRVGRAEGRHLLLRRVAAVTDGVDVLNNEQQLVLFFIPGNSELSKVLG